MVIEFYIADKERKKTIKSLSKYFDDNAHSLKMEKGIYHFTKQYCQSNSNNLLMARAIYRDKTEDIMYNLEQNHSTVISIKKKVKRNKYNPYNLAFLHPDELDKDNWSKITLRKLTTEDKLNNLPTIEWKSCRDCKRNEYFYYQLQTRSADEPMTTFYICKNCDKRYKVNN